METDRTKKSISIICALWLRRTEWNTQANGYCHGMFHYVELTRNMGFEM